MSEWRGIEYYEESPSSPQEMAAQDGASVMRKLQFPMVGGVGWELREQIRREWLGFLAIGQNLTQRWLLRETPHYLPGNILGDGLPFLYAQSLVHSEMRGPADSEEAFAIGGAAGDHLALYPRWIATFEYRSVPWEVREDDDDLILAQAGPLAAGIDVAHPDEGDALRRGWINTRNIVKRREPSGRVIPIRTPPFKFVGLLDDALKPVQTTEPIPLNESWETIWYRWICPLGWYPTQDVELCMNTVNDGAFDGHSLGTLLLVAREENVRRDPFGQWVMEVTYKCSYCPKVNRAGVPLGHNAIYYPYGNLGPGYYLISTDGTNDTAKMIYRFTDYTKLFRPVQP